MYLVCLSVYLTFTDSIALNCNAMHRAMSTTVQNVFLKLESESVFELVKAE